MRLRVLAAALPLLAGALGAGYDTGQKAGQPAGQTSQQTQSPASAEQGQPPMQGQQGGMKAMPMTPEQVLSKMHTVNEMEIKVGRLAQEKSQNPEVRRYGKVLERDHQFGDKKVVGLAQSEGLKVQTMPPEPDEQMMMQKLQQASGKEFDAQFLKAMKMGHDKAISMLDMAQKQTQDQRLAGLIGKMLPILRQHDHLAASLQG